MEKSSRNAVANECTEVAICIDGSSSESPDYSDAEDQSWHSPYTSHGGNLDEDDDGGDEDDIDGSICCSDHEIAGAVSDPPISDNSDVDLEKGPNEVNGGSDNGVRDQMGQLDRSGSNRSEKECRICHLALEVSTQEAGTSIVLGCACKADLAAAHKQCAEAWFKIKGNRTCEICGSTARNVNGVEDGDFMEQWNEGSTTTTPASTEPRNFWRGHRFLNFLLACMVFAFVISWLFHFNIPS